MRYFWLFHFVLMFCFVYLCGTCTQSFMGTTDTGVKYNTFLWHFVCMIRVKKSVSSCLFLDETQNIFVIC